MKETGRGRKRDLVACKRKQRMQTGLLRRLRNIPCQGIAGVLLHPFAQIKIRMLVPIIIDSGKDMMNFEGMRKRNNGQEDQGKGEGKTSSQWRNAKSLESGPGHNHCK